MRSMLVFRLQYTLTIIFVWAELLQFKMAFALEGIEVADASSPNT